jgi:hypothetical protein
VPAASTTFECAWGNILFTFSKLTTLSLAQILYRRRAGWRSGNVLGRCSVQISAEKLAILTSFFLGFPQILQANSGIVPRLGHRSFPVHYLSVIVHSTLYDVATGIVVR